MQTNKNIGLYFLIFMSMLFITLQTLSGILVFKILNFGWMKLPGGVFVFPLCFSVVSVITEIYGKNVCKFVIYSANFCSVIFVCGAAFFSLLPSPPGWEHQDAFENMYKLMPLPLISGLIANTISERVNSNMVHKLKGFVKGTKFWFRSLIAHALGHAIYTLVACSIMYGPVMSLNKVIMIMMSVYILKLIYSVIVLPLEVIVVALVNWSSGGNAIKQYVKHFDIQVYKHRETVAPKLRAVK